MAWNKGRRFWPDLNGLEWRKLVLAQLKWFVMEEVGFNLTQTAWNRESRFWPNINGLSKDLHVA
jgi:hypothetical protein